jgi:hypothetical protein
MQDQRRKTSRRALAVLAGVLLLGAAVTPSFSASEVTKKQAKKVAKKQVRTLGGKLFVEEGQEFARYNFRMTAGDPDRPIGTFGPFTLKAHCEQTGGTNYSQILLSTSEGGSIFHSQEDNETPFDPSDGFLVFSQSADTAGGPPYDPYYDMIAHAASPSGTFLQAFVANYNDVGIDCSMAGYISVSDA